MAFTHQHLLGLEGLPRDEILYLIDTAVSFKEISERDIKKVPTLRGKTVVSLFYEASTRTRTSFEIAAKRLSADYVNIAVVDQQRRRRARRCSTRRATSPPCGPTAMVIRHTAAGAPHFLAKRIECPVINAGDGAHEHPTQALLDLLTIREHMRPARRPQRGDRRRHPAQPRRALERARAARARRARPPGRSADPRCRRGRPPGARSTTTCAAASAAPT